MSGDDFGFLQEPVDPKDLRALETLCKSAWVLARDKDSDMAYVLGKILGALEATPEEAKPGLTVTLSFFELGAVIYGIHACRSELAVRKARLAPVKGSTLTDEDLPLTIPAEPMPVGSRYLDPESNTIRCGHCCGAVVCPKCEGDSDERASDDLGPGGDTGR